MTTYTQKAIEGAIEGGYDNEMGLFNLPDFSPYDSRLIHAVLFLDPLFWSSLGKAEGWNDDPYQYTNEHDIPGWHVKWLMLIDHLAEGRDIESFFEGLLSGNTTKG